MWWCRASRCWWAASSFSRWAGFCCFLLLLLGEKKYGSSSMGAASIDNGCDCVCCGQPPARGACLGHLHLGLTEQAHQAPTILLASSFPLPLSRAGAWTRCCCLASS